MTKIKGSGVNYLYIYIIILTIVVIIIIIIIIIPLEPFVGPRPLFQFFGPIHSRKDSWHWGSETERPLPQAEHKQNKHTNTDIHAQSGIRTHDPCVRASDKTIHGLDRAATVMAHIYQGKGKLSVLN
jgi:hypothetical protein